jgi:prolipoprotein diacylglyceryltransferase
LALTSGAFSTPAGLLVGLGLAAIYLWRRQILGASFLDALAPAVALMFAFTSLANLSSGSAYGATSDLPWAIELWGARRHPTQIYELIAALTTLGILLWAHPRRPYDGFTMLLFLALYSVSRLFLEAFRGDPWVIDAGYRGVQIIALGALVLSLWLMGQQSVRTSDA